MKSWKGKHLPGQQANSLDRQRDNLEADGMKIKRLSLTVFLLTFLLIAILVGSTGAARIGDAPDAWQSLFSPVNTMSVKHRQTHEDRRSLSTAGLTTNQGDRRFALASNIPLKARYLTLVKLADAGDGKAACLLAWSLDFCLNKHSFLDQAEVSIANVELSGASGQNRIQSALSSADHYDRLFIDSMAMCNGFSQPEEESVARRLYQAASHGSIRSMSKFAVNPTVARQIDISSLEDMTLYKENARSFLIQAALAGDPEAIMGVYYVHKQGYLATQYGRLPMKLDASTVAYALTIISESVDVKEAADAPDLLNKLLATMTNETRNSVQEVVRRQEASGLKRRMEQFRQQPHRSPQEVCDIR